MVKMCSNPQDPIEHDLSLPHLSLPVPAQQNTDGYSSSHADGETGSTQQTNPPVTSVFSDYNRSMGIYATPPEKQGGYGRPGGYLIIHTEPSVEEHDREPPEPTPELETLGFPTLTALYSPKTDRFPSDVQ